MPDIGRKTVSMTAAAFVAPVFGAPARPASGYFRVVGPAVVLGLEAGLLTPFVEFSGGLMEPLASGRVCSALLVALAALCVFMRRDKTPGRHWIEFPHVDLVWAVAHLAVFGVFVLLTLRLQHLRAASADAGAAALWTVLALTVAGTAFLTFNGPAPAGVVRHVPVARAMAALCVGGAFALMIPLAQACWPPLSGPAMALGRTLLRWTYGEGLSGTDASGFPILGTRPVLLQITPGCAEMDAILAFWLLSTAAIALRFREVRLGRAIVAAVAGAAFIYVLNALRIYGLVVVAIQVSPDACVRLAHSRVSQLVFLAMPAGLAAGPLRWYVLAPCRFASRQARTR